MNFSQVFLLEDVALVIVNPLAVEQCNSGKKKKKKNSL